MDEFASRQYPVKEHMRFQRRMWVVERICWGVLAAIALLGLTGLFGTGWLSRGKAAGDDLSIEYERFERSTRLSGFAFHFPPGANERTLHLNRVFQKNYEISRIQPEPKSSQAGPDGFSLTFALPPEGGTVMLWAHARGYGVSRIEARADNGPPLPFSIMVYP